MAKGKEKKTKNPGIHCDYLVKLYEDGKYNWMYNLNMLNHAYVAGNDFSFDYNYISYHYPKTNN